jgi:hypothetical protein
MPEEAADKLLLHAAKQPFYNTSPVDLCILALTLNPTVHTIDSSSTLKAG